MVETRLGDQSVKPSAPFYPRIGILGHVGNKNLGDEAIIAAVIQNIRRRWPDAEILGFTSVPGDTEERHKIRSFPLRQPAPSYSASNESPGDGDHVQRQVEVARSWQVRSKDLLRRFPALFNVARRASQALETTPRIGREVGFLADCRKHVRGLDLLIFAGSHQLNDFVDGPWAFPYTVLKWTLLARAAGAKVVFLSMGAGPIEIRLGRFFIRHAQKMASYRSYRDVTGKKVVDALNVSENQAVVPDLAFSLSLPPLAEDLAERTSGPVVGFNPLPLYAEYWYTSDSSKYEAYVTKLATFADWLVSRGCEVRFVSTQLLVDPAVVEDVRLRMRTDQSDKGHRRIAIPSIRDLDGLLQVLSDVDIMVATRYHGVLLSLALQKPVLAIAYHKKTRDLMQWLELGEYVVEGDTFEPEELSERFTRLEGDVPKIRRSLQKKVPGLKKAVQDQYGEIFRLLE